jgi:predicted MPP superfamily phosphohydrolase
MRTIFPILLFIILAISWINWRLLIKWNPYYKSRTMGYGYWLITALSWLMISYGWVIHPEKPFFYQWITPLVNLSFIWILGGIFLVFLFPILFAIRKILQCIPSAKGKPDHKGIMITSRRTFLQTMIYAAPILTLGVSTYGVYSAEKEMVVHRFTLPFAGIPKDLKGFKIAQISDTHLGTFFTLDRLDHVIQLVSQEKPDIVVITGDLIDDLGLLEPCIEKLSQLASFVPYGIFFCWGNHEYFHDIKRIREALLKSPIHILENSHVAMKVGEATLCMLGVDYPWPQSAFEKDNIRQQFMSMAEKNAPADSFKILLAHHPDFLFNSFASKIPLTLSGHTHGGQINFEGKSLLPFAYHYMRGLYQENNDYGYVNTGAGQWMPVRIGCPPEISVFTLNG